jgi:dipeptidyl aminopeptidase
MLAGLVVLAAIIGIVAGSVYTGMSYRPRGAKHITMDHLYNDTFTPTVRNLHWVPEGDLQVFTILNLFSEELPLAGDGVFSVLEDGFIKLVDLKNNSTRTLVAESDIKDVRHQKSL